MPARAPASDPEPPLAHVTAIVVAYLERNRMPRDELGALIADVRAALEREPEPTSTASPGKRRQRQPLRPTSDPAVPITESVTPDWIVSLETGRRYKVLAKHLRAYGLTPDAYRARWGLPADYPMTAPNYAAWLSAHAGALGRRELEPPRSPSEVIRSIATA